ncbi:AraC family transcriptional regulator [Enterococcus sp.]|uniref:AraC family transcriptional regulator n=1 Tax=Enterococcus sp. TaxID=35783 RepID=UPI0028AFA8C4|nr:AraC family transcriptional regulator [Enterococcus sp.]
MDYWEKANHTWSTDSLRYINTSTQKQRELFYYIQEIGYFKASKPYFTERENLPSYLIKYTLSGKGELFYQDKRTVIEAGDVFFIDCKEYQYYKTISNEPWEMDWIHIYGGNTRAFYEEFIKNGSNTFRTTKKGLVQNPIHLFIQDLLTLQQEPNAKTAFQSSIFIHQLLNELLLQKYRQDFSSTDIPDYVLAMRELIDEEFRQSITLERLEETFHRNKYQLVKEFSKYIGVPPIDYQINKRISYAKDLLRYSRMSIKEISLAVGIENTAYFSRLFKNKAGISPSDYRHTENGW